ncbi:MAG TPA: tyrosine-type recombinase/integrase [Jiangellaceae bacterium]|nr:tyrosine-type recombinase/integrase [Jiangellaceae bacterium]
MTSLSQAVEDYLTVRRTLGHKLVDHGVLLPDFVAYLEAAGASTVTVELALAWATQPSDTTPVWWGRRLAVVRGFARHLKAFDPDTEIPSRDLLPYRCRRVSPYLYSEADVAALMAAARALRSPLRAATYETLIGLIAATGMRSGEAVRLDRDDIDWDQGVVTVWHSKFHKSRALPVHSSTLEALARYDRIRDDYVGRPKAPSFFVSTVGTRLNNDDDKTFRRLVRHVGLVSSSGRRPRLHDLRHTFAVRTLLGWYRAGVDVEAHMPLLSTYLGHSAPGNTYWYLSAVPELLFLASERLERGGQARS